jgi:hypothetical protein
MKALGVVRCRGSHIFLDSQLTDGDELVSPTRRPPFTPRIASVLSYPLHFKEEGKGKTQNNNKKNKMLGNLPV